LDRNSRSVLANLARRAGSPLLCARILKSVIRPTKPLAHPATDFELKEYAAALISLGAINEGQDLLRMIDAEAEPEVYLYEGIAHISKWNYSLAIPPLINFVSINSLSTYQKLVGKLNLTSAWIVNRQTSLAIDGLNEILELAIENNFQLLAGFAYEQLGQAYIRADQLDEATKCLSCAETFLKESSNNGALWVKKWQALILMRQGKTDIGLKQLSLVRDESLRKSDYETLRDCDLIESLLTKNPELLLKVYFGTSHEAYRNRITQHLAPELQIPSSYQIQIGPSNPEAPIFDVLEGRFSGSNAHLKEGAMFHRLVQALASDFYKPKSTVEIFSILYPSEYFNPLSSPHRVQQLIFRFRESNQNFKNLLRIDEINGAYGIRSETGLILKVYKSKSVLGGEFDVKINKIREFAPGGPISGRQISQILDLNQRSVQRFLKKGVDENRLIRTGQGKSTRYSLAA